MTVRVVIESKATGERHYATASHPTSSIAAGNEACDSCWAEFGKPDQFGYTHRIVEAQVWAYAGRICW